MTHLRKCPPDICLSDDVCLHICNHILQSVDNGSRHGMTNHEIWNDIEPRLMVAIRNGDITGPFGFHQHLTATEAFEMILEWLVNQRYLQQVTTRRLHPLRVGQSHYYAHDTEIMRVMADPKAPPPFTDAVFQDTNSV